MQGFGQALAKTSPAESRGLPLVGGVQSRQLNFRHTAEQLSLDMWQGTGGATTGVAGGGAEARPAEASGRDLGGERLADFEQVSDECQ